MPERCWMVFSALRSAVSIARALPSSRIRSEPGGTCAPSSTSISIRMSASSARKNAAATGNPHTTIASRLSITPENRASGGITLSEVTSCPPPGSPSPRSSASVARTKASRSKPGSANTLVNEPRDDVAVAPADLHLRPRVQHQEAFAVGVRLDLAYLIQVDDRRAVHPLEHPRVET